MSKAYSHLWTALNGLYSYIPSNKNVPNNNNNNNNNNSNIMITLISNDNNNANTENKKNF